MATPNPFPLNIVSKVNNPELLAWLQQFGHDKYADALDLNKVFQALQFLYENLGYGIITVTSGITQLGQITRSGNTIIFHGGWTWRINGQDYGDPTDVDIIIPVPLATDGFYRTDIFVADDNDNIFRIQGVENATVSIQPATPVNTVFISVIIVYGDTVYNPTYPIFQGQNNFVRKIEIPENLLSGAGTIEEQICEYILLLQPAQRTILETDSKWNVVIVDALPTPPVQVFNNIFNNKFQ